MTKFTVSYTKKKLFGTWQFGKIDVLVNIINKKFPSLNSKQFSQFFWGDLNLRELRAFILRKVLASVVERQKSDSATQHSVWERRHTLILFQFEIDHVTQKPKETCQRTCKGP